MFPTSQGQRLDGVGIDGKRTFDFRFCPIDLCVGRGIHDDIWTGAADRWTDAVRIQEIQSRLGGPAQRRDLSKASQSAFQFMGNLATLADQKDAHGLPDRQRLATEGVQGNAFTVFG